VPTDLPTSEFPDEGTVTIAWTTTMIEGRRRRRWTYRSDPTVDPRLAIGLLRDVALELEIDVSD
jgi:hypothetical protein